MKRKRENFKNFLFICITFSYLIFYVLLYLKILYIGYKLEKLKEEYEGLNLLNKSYTLELTKLTTLDTIMKIAREKNIELVVPQNWCFIEIENENEQILQKKKILEARER